jgi:hypothetical protein
MVESAQDRHGHNWPIPGVGWQNGGRWIRNLLVQSLMWSCLIEVGNVGLEDAEEVLFMEDQQMIKAFPAHARPRSVHPTHWHVERGMVCFRTLVLEPLATRAKSGPNFASLSRMRNRGVCPYGVASRSG